MMGVYSKRCVVHFRSFACAALVIAFLSVAQTAHAEFKAGAAIIDITPTKLPVLVNGGMTSRSLDKIKTRVHARAIVMSDGNEQLAIVVVDSCMMGRVLLDDAKSLAKIRTGIPVNRILISATHAHSAPSAMGALGTDADPDYVPFLRDKLAEVIAAAQAAQQPARVGFASAQAPEFTALRQWIRRPDRIAEDPFGNLTVRANMHAGANWDDAVGEAGPEDPELSLISVQTKDGKPLAMLGNFSMHYFSDVDISADYFGLFADGLKQRIAPDGNFVGIMSHGCSGDIWRRDYTKPEAWDPNLTIEAYAQGLLDIAMKAYVGIQYRDDVSLAMAEQRMTLKYRVPDKQRLEWAQRIVAAMGDRLPKETAEVYAREQIILHQAQQTEIVVQALRIGDIAIATTPNETYAITGLKIKAASPLAHTMVIELANGGDGYIPPAEQYPFGGYNTWEARSAGLEVKAEAKISQAAISLLETVSGKPRRSTDLPLGPRSDAIMKQKPLAWWRLNEFTGPIAADASGHHRNALYEAATTFYLEGPRSAEFCGPDSTNRSAHFVGGRLRSRILELGKEYSVSLWIWNGMPNDGRNVTGWFYSRDHDNGLSAFGEHLGIGGKSGHTGKLIFQHGQSSDNIVAGQTEIPRWTWQHVLLIRNGENVKLLLNGQPELETTAPPVSIDDLMFGGRSDNDSNWEGRLDEVVIFDRAFTDEETSAITPGTAQPVHE